MATNNKPEFGWLTMGKGYKLLINATDFRSAVIIWVKSIMKLPENSPVSKADGTHDFKATLQNWHNDYKSVILENAENDGNDYITTISLDETADHIINTYCFLCENRKYIAPHIILPELLDLFKRWNIQE